MWCNIDNGFKIGIDCIFVGSDILDLIKIWFLEVF